MTTCTSGIASRRTRPRSTAADVPGERKGRVGPGAIMPTMATETSSSIVPASGHAPSSWGLGDGQAIPWEYAPAPESRDIVTIKERYGLFIGGRFVPAKDGATFSTVNPATEEKLALVAKGSPADADRAVRAARRAQTRSWGALPGKERAKSLFRIARILQERSREFAVLESMDTGTPS